MNACRYGIRYIVNVTPDVENKFEGDSEFRYMKISIADKWNSEVSMHFENCCKFIGTINI